MIPLSPGIIIPKLSHFFNYYFIGIGNRTIARSYCIRLPPRRPVFRLSPIRSHCCKQNWRHKHSKRCPIHTRKNMDNNFIEIMVIKCSLCIKRYIPNIYRYPNYPCIICVAIAPVSYSSSQLMLDRTHTEIIKYTIFFIFNSFELIITRRLNQLIIFKQYTFIK